MPAKNQYSPKSLLRSALLLFAALFHLSVAAETSMVMVLDHSGVPLEHAIVAATQTGTPPETLPVAVVDQVEKRFQPRVSVIAQGQSVSFPNSDNIRHHVYSFSKARKFELKLYKGEPGRLITFETPGIVSLGCNIHDRMRGYIYVNAPDEIAMQTNSAGVAQLPAKNPETLYVWHEQLLDPRQRQQVNYTEWKRQGDMIVVTVATRSVIEEPQRSFTPRF